MNKPYKMAITVSLTLDMLQTLDNYCMNNDTTRSKVISEALQDKFYNQPMLTDLILGGKDNGTE